MGGAESSEAKVDSNGVLEPLVAVVGDVLVADR